MVLNRSTVLPAGPQPLAPLGKGSAMARPVRQDRSARTRDRLLQAAIEIFAEKGFERSSISEIAAHAGCATGSVYFRYVDKSGLFQAAFVRLLEDMEGRWHVLLAQTVACGASPEQKIDAAVRFLAEELGSRPGLMQGFIQRVPGAQTDEPQLRQMRQGFIDGLAQIVQALQPGRSAEDTLFATTIAFQIITGFVFNATLNGVAPAPLPDTRTVEALSQAVRAYLASP